jgi:hypothetical protein
VIGAVDGNIKMAIASKERWLIINKRDIRYAQLRFFRVEKKYFHWFTFAAKCYFNKCATPKGVARLFLSMV